NWWNEALHGIARAGVATVFPQAIGLAATFDPELVGKVADVIATEGRAKYHASVRRGDRDIYKGLTFWAPNINIFRDPRWGRGHETYGEDPWLTARLGLAFVRGLQGDDPHYLKAAACAKHYAVHSGPEADRHSFDAIVSDKDLFETYLPAFEALVREGGVEAVMGAYNRVNGTPACGNQRLLAETLRELWGFDGHVTSDCWAIRDFNEGHNYTATIEESAALAVKAGCDLNCGNAYLHLLAAIQDGLLDEADIDRSLVRLFTARLRLGMFDEDFSIHPYATIPYDRVDCPEHRVLNLNTALHSVVLLENDGILPLKVNQFKRIAVIGPTADHPDSLLGNYTGTPSETWSVLRGIREVVPASVDVRYAQGSHLYLDPVSGLCQKGHLLAEALEVASISDVVVLCLGLDATLEGEEGDAGNAFASGDKLGVELPETQQRLLDAMLKTDKPIVLILLSGSALAPGQADRPANAVIQAFYPGALGGLAVAKILSGEFSPCGCLPVTFYQSTADLPDFRDYAMANRTYRYFTGKPLYRFGHGLSYARFFYQNLIIKRQNNDSDLIQVTIHNRGPVAAFRVIQLYMQTPGAGHDQPKEQLRGIRKIHLEPGESCDVLFEVQSSERLLYDEKGVRSIVPPAVTYSLLGADSLSD
ncbi:MAG TPA: glycosyl hydrolase, partial [Clostridiales bacterium]|nr:glycosyl hydrolase [Clostridiales bacterium]